MDGILLSHHPICDNFTSHTLRFGKHRLCIGCFIGYPTALIGIIIIYFLLLFRVLTSSFFFYISFILLSFFILSPLGLTQIKKVKILQKILIGLGSAFLFWHLWTLPNPFVVNFIYFILIFGLLMILLNTYHAYGFYQTCKKCQYALNWEQCPAFSKMFECFRKYNLKNVFQMNK
jgi:hypothetical protein